MSNIDFEDNIELWPEFEKLRSRKEIIPLRIVYFVDAWHFRLACRKLTIEKKNIMLAQERQRGNVINSASLPIAPELSATAHAITDYMTRVITNRVVALAETELRKDLLIFPSEAEFCMKYDEAKVDWLRDRIEHCEAIVDPLRIIKVYAGKPPSPEYMRRQYERALASGAYEKGTPGYNLLMENIELAQEGKLKTVFSNQPVNFSDYESFLNELIGYGRDEEKFDHNLQFGITRVDVADGGTVGLSEKGVDAHLMLGLLDEQENSQTSAVCLITNDNDYYPIVERIKKSSRPFFLGSTTPPSMIASALRKTVGEEWIVSVNSMEDLKDEKMYASAEWFDVLGP